MSRKAKSKAWEAAAVYQIKVTLLGCRPPIWRRLLMQGNTTLDRLHRFLQTAMGWTDSHLHQFIVGERYIGPRIPSEDLDVEDERRFRLDDVARRPKAKFIYEYDFGDSWQHEILVEKVLGPEDGAPSPACVAGARACPPEDCGGVWGYASLLKTLSNPKHPEYREMKEWAGNIDSERFDVDAVNSLLSGRRQSRWVRQLEF
jgi:hypothetical protein